MQAEWVRLATFDTGLEADLAGSYGKSNSTAKISSKGLWKHRREATHPCHPAGPQGLSGPSYHCVVSSIAE